MNPNALLDLAAAMDRASQAIRHWHNEPEDMRRQAQRDMAVAMVYVALMSEHQRSEFIQAVKALVVDAV